MRGTRLGAWTGLLLAVLFLLTPLSAAAASHAVHAHAQTGAGPTTLAGFLSANPFVLPGAAALVIGVVLLFVLLAHRRRSKAREQQRQAEEQHRDAVRRLVERDALTGIFNEQHFLERASVMLRTHAERRFVMVRLDINRFALVNSYFGAAEGDRVLRYLADAVGRYVKANPPGAYGRVSGDVFALCCPYGSDADAHDMMQQLQTELSQYNIAFHLVLTFGLYVIADRSLPTATMLDRAAAAAKTVKGNYATPYAYYTEELGEQITREQELINDMPGALAQGQFSVKIQPVYDLQTAMPTGGETLVRWTHPQKGAVPPDSFIPVFEKNGLIMRLDAFVWEEACKLLRTWLDEGREPYPISVNVSRVNLYNPNIVEELLLLVERYALPPPLLQLEMTESAYSDNPQAMKQVVALLRERGFTILMDDFGNGYSSLNILKDIDIDLLKIDMRFLSKSEIPGRGENIIASVVRMAKWLGLPVVAEGAERKEQIEFLRSIGCEYAQGYYFSEAVAPEAYARMMQESAPSTAALPDAVDVSSLWASNAQMEGLFSSALYAAGLYEFDPDTQQLDCLRVNSAYNDLFGYIASRHADSPPLQNAVGEYRDVLLDAVYEAVESRNAAHCEYLRRTPGGKHIWVDLKLKYLSAVGGKHVLLGSFFDITAYKETEQELQRFRSAISDAGRQTRRLLVVDDQQVNREILKKIFAPAFAIIEAADGQEALDLLADEKNLPVDAILLDMVMPVMDGEAFLNIKREDKAISDIPVIIVTADDSEERQINMLAIGAHDYIVKPLIAEVVKRRVNNVIESSTRFRTMLREYQSVVEQAKADPLTRVYNRAAAEQMITGVLAREPDLLHALVMIDLDDFKSINDTYGHSYGDMVLMEFGTKLTTFFRAGDIVARMGGDEFCVFMRNVRTAYAAQDKCQELLRTVRRLSIGDENVRVTCSAGVAVSTPTSTFGELYRQADSALYASKRANKNRSTLYANTRE